MNVWGRLEEGFGEVEGVWRGIGIGGDLGELGGGGKGLEWEVGSFGKGWRG